MSRRTRREARAVGEERACRGRAKTRCERDEVEGGGQPCRDACTKARIGASGCLLRFTLLRHRNPRSHTQHIAG